MSGDGNIGSAGTATVSTPANYRFGGSTTSESSTADYSIALTTAAWTTVNSLWSWTQNDYHQKTGNLLLADGSAQGATLSGVHSYLSNSTNSNAGEAFTFLP